MSHETIYMSLFVQGRGALRKELTACLRSGRAMRRPRHVKGGFGQGQLTNMVMISERPAEINDRAVPGHWEGDLIFGRRMTAIGTLVERWSRYVMLVALPDGHTAEAVRIALAAKITTLPDALRQSLTWDQGKEMADHVRFSVDTGVHVYFCDPKSPWQRGSNENTNGLLRQYLPTHHRPRRRHPTRPRPHRRITQRAPSTNTQLAETIREVRRGRCDDPLRPHRFLCGSCGLLRCTTLSGWCTRADSGRACWRQCRCSSQRGLPAAVSVLQCPHAGQVGVAVAVERVSGGGVGRVGA